MENDTNIRLSGKEAEKLRNKKLDEFCEKVKNNEGYYIFCIKGQDTIDGNDNMPLPIKLSLLEVLLVNTIKSSQDIPEENKSLVKDVLIKGINSCFE